MAAAARADTLSAFPARPPPSPRYAALGITLRTRRAPGCDLDLFDR